MDIVVRPSMKLTRTAYTIVFLVLFVCVLAYTNSVSLQRVTPLVLLIPALLLVWPIRSHIRRHFTKMTIAGDKLQYQAGVFNRSTRTVQTSKVQNVRVAQTLRQRLVGTGDIAIETAGASSSLTMEDIDNPQQVADMIIEYGGQGARKGK